MICENTQKQLISDVYNLKDLALYNAQKYKWDPTIGRMHNEYLRELNEIIDRIQKQK